MKKIRYVAAGLVAALSLGACNEGLTELNQNPNNPEDVPATTLFTTGVRNTATRWGGGYSLRGAEFLVQHLAEVQYPDEDAYKRLGPGDTQAYFDNPYVNELEDFQKVIQKGKALEAPGTWAPALILQSFGFMKLTDTFGDIPYSAALAGDSIGGSHAPAYDSQKDIYDALFVKLAEAVTALQGSNAGSLGTGDPVYGGSAVKWQRFANSLRARLAMRLANVDAAKASAELQAAIAAPGGLMASNDDNAQLNWPGDGVYDNPWSVSLQTRDDYRVSKTFVDQLAAVNDPRLPIFAQPTAANATVYAGLQNALTHAAAGAFFNTTSLIGEFAFPSATAYGTFRGGGAKAPTYFMTYPEVQFILAEAAERGMGGLNAGQAAGYYTAGVTASMQMWSNVELATGGSDAITAAEISAYLGQPAVAYQAGVAGQTKIALQKWFHLFTDGGEAWAEWRRTCVPATVRPGPDANQNTVPRRLMYSPSEFTTNRASVTAAVTSMGEDTFNARMYWDSNPTAAPTHTATCGVRP